MSDPRSPLLPPIVPHMARRGSYRPEVGDDLKPNYVTVDLPGEKVRAIIVGVVNDDAIIAKLVGPMISKTHTYKAGDPVPCRRGIDGMGVEVWSAVSERELDMAEAAERFEREERRRAAAEAEARSKQVAEAKLPPPAPPPPPEPVKRTVLGPRRNRVARSA
jgi:hypothetical protein